MTRGDDLRTLDILEACSSLSEVVHARGTVNEEILLRAAERLLEIIGEAATNCSPALKDRHPEVDWEGIAGLRVVLAHHGIAVDLIDTSYEGRGSSGRMSVMPKKYPPELKTTGVDEEGNG